MKKLMTMIAAVATAFGLYAADPSITDNAVNFSEFTDMNPWDLTDKNKQTDELWTYADGATAATPATDEAKIADGKLVLATGAKILARKFADDPVSVNDELGLFANVKIDFQNQGIDADSIPTAADLADAKLALFLLDTSDVEGDVDDSAKGTNLFAIAGCGSTRALYLLSATVDDTFLAQEHTFTIKFYNQALSTSNRAGFMIYMDGEKEAGKATALKALMRYDLVGEVFNLANGTACDSAGFNYLGDLTVNPKLTNWYNDQRLLVSLMADNDQSFAGVEFKGKASIASIKLTDDKDQFAFIPDDSKAIGVDDTGLATKLTADDFTFDPEAGASYAAGVITVFDDTTQITVTPNFSKVIRSITIGERSGTDSLTFAITDDDGNGLVVKEADAAAYVTIDGQTTPYETFENAFGAAKDSDGSTLTLNANIDGFEYDGENSMILDLAGKTISGDGLTDGLGVLYVSAGVLTITNSVPGQGGVVATATGGIAVNNVVEVEEETSEVTAIGTVKIVGGNFTGLVQNFYEDIPETMTYEGIEATAGTFSFDPTDKFVADGYEAVDNKDGTWTVQEKVISKGTVIFICEKPALDAEPFEAEVGADIEFPEMANFVFSNWTNGEGQVVSKVQDGTIQLSPQIVDIVLNKDSSGNYEIAKKEDLQTLQAVVNAGFDCAGKTFKQTAETIDMTGLLWTGIGNKDGTLYFAGTYDGNGKKIENVTLDAAQKSYMGFFRYVKGGTIKDLTVETDGFGNLPTDGFGGNYEYGGAAIVGIALDSTLSGLTAEGQIGTETDPTTHNAGGIAVETVACTIEDCISKVALYCAYSKAAGIVVFDNPSKALNDKDHPELGYKYDYDHGSVISNCRNEGAIVGIQCWNNAEGKRWEAGDGEKKAFKDVASDGFGGILGWTGNSTFPVALTNNANTASITADVSGADHIGGFIGEIIGEVSNTAIGAGNTGLEGKPLIGTIAADADKATDFHYTAGGVQPVTLAAGGTFTIEVANQKTTYSNGKVKPELALATGDTVTFITNKCTYVVDFAGITVDTEKDELKSEVVENGVKFTATALPPPGPKPVDPSEGTVVPDPVEANTFIVTPAEGKASVELQDTDSSMIIKVTSAADFTIAGLNGATVKVVGANGADITEYVKGGTAPFDTALSDAAKATLVTETEEQKPLVIGDNVDVTINTVNGLKYQLIRGIEVGTITTEIGEPKLGDGKPLKLTDADKPAGKAFYVIQTSK